ncbi:MAG: hypothetical protein V7K64_28020 [Nostoc sp.]|uniref:hypothetical protein n=1 Tax=unclassified Nostoc TaxID=2593658 RepID=UPI001DFEFA51|nr:hypothetical protein [Nostoc sp. JL34]MBN3883366.1 hypothetical protein [Nostoc sp. JL34]
MKNSIPLWVEFLGIGKNYNASRVGAAIPLQSQGDRVFRRFLSMEVEVNNPALPHPQFL